MGSKELAIPDLGLSEDERQARFEALQAKLVPLWSSIQSFNTDEQTVVVVPSLTVEFELSPVQIQAYEERFLFLLLLLRQPRARLVYVTSQAIHPAVLDYYFDLMPNVIASHARRRLFLVSPQDGGCEPLTTKLLKRPRLLAQIRSLIPDRDRAHLVPFNATRLERDLAICLGIPMYAADPRFAGYGTKTGGRRLFREVGVDCPLGEEALSSLDAVTEALVRMRAERPTMRRALVKLNEGVSGDGNAEVDLTDLPPPGDATEATAVRERLDRMRFEAVDATLESFSARLEAGGVVEERIEGEGFRSPSVQLRVTPLREVEILSSHDQVLGGASGQTFLGCRFPADPAYATLITRAARKVGERLAAEGVLGRSAVDFVVVRDESGAWRSYAIELNLRKGGTTHPFLTLQFLTDGRYDADTGRFTAPSGRTKCFVATDYLTAAKYRALTPDDILDILARHQLAFDQSHQTGVVFHMMTALGECGRLGLTAVGDTPEQAQSYYDRTIEILDREATDALATPPLP